MASISKEPGGRRTIQFIGADKKRRSIRLGKCPQRTTEAIKVKVEALVAASLSKQAIDDETARWLQGIGDDLAEKLAAVGLIPERKRLTLSLGQFIKEYIEARHIKKPNTLKNYKATEKSLLEFFGADRLLVDITPGTPTTGNLGSVAKATQNRRSAETSSGRSSFLGGPCGRSTSPRTLWPTCTLPSKSTNRVNTS